MIGVAANPAIRRAVMAMRGYDRPWGIAGGWAIDLFLGEETRAHADLDVATLRVDQARLRSHLATATVAKVVDGAFSDWIPGEELPTDVHEVWATLADGGTLELLLNDSDPVKAEWLFRRDRRVRRPLADVIHHRADVPHLAPEIVLLYKAKSPAGKDAEDFGRTVPRLSSEQRAWMRAALALAHPGHPWAALL